MQTSPIWPDTPERLDKARTNYGRFRDLSRRYREDASLRARIDGGDTADSVAALGIDVPEGIEARIVADTPGTVHLVMPPDPNVALSEEALRVSAGGKTAGTAGSIGTASTAACSSTPSTLSSGASAGTAGTNS